jgi:hypothetical protein
MKIFISVLLLSLTVITNAAPKHTISGTISDISTGELLIGASVVVKELPGTGITSNAYGYFSL